MSLAPIWLLVAIGWVIIAALATLRLRYPYKTIQTDHFVIQVPQPWLHHSIYVVALLELCWRTAGDSFNLPQESRAKIEIRPRWWPLFWFEPATEQIMLCFLFGPAIDRWLFSVYFAVAHEYGHFILRKQTPILSEAWANLFSLYTLGIVASSYSWPYWWERWFVQRDNLAGLVILYIWQFLPGNRSKISTNFWRLWQIAQQDSKAVVSEIGKIVD